MRFILCDVQDTTSLTQLEKFRVAPTSFRCNLTIDSACPRVQNYRE